MTGALIKSGISGAVLTVVFLWAFGMPVTWSAFLFWAFVSLLAIIVGATFLFALKWALLIAIVKELFDE